MRGLAPVFYLHCPPVGAAPSVCVCVCVYIYIYIYIHTYTQSSKTGLLIWRSTLRALSWTSAISPSHFWARVSALQMVHLDHSNICRGRPPSKWKTFGQTCLSACHAFEAFGRLVACSMHSLTSLCSILSCKWLYAGWRTVDSAVCCHCCLSDTAFAVALPNSAASAPMILQPVQRDDLLRDCSFCGFKGVVISTTTLQVT